MYKSKMTQIYSSTGKMKDIYIKAGQVTRPKLEKNPAGQLILNFKKKDIEPAVLTGIKYIAITETVDHSDKPAENLEPMKEAAWKYLNTAAMLNKQPATAAQPAAQPPEKPAAIAEHGKEIKQPQNRLKQAGSIKTDGRPATKKQTWVIYKYLKTDVRNKT